MKTIVFTLTLLICTVSHSLFSQEVKLWEEIEVIKEVYYYEGELFTGRIHKHFSNGNLQWIWNIKAGNWHGLWQI